jgi:hypothetical protein
LYLPQDERTKRICRVPTCAKYFCSFPPPQLSPSNRNFLHTNNLSDPPLRGTTVATTIVPDCRARQSCIAHGAPQAEVLFLNALSPRVRRVSYMAQLRVWGRGGGSGAGAAEPALTRAAPPFGRTVRAAHVGLRVGAFSCLLAVSLAVAMQASGVAADDLLAGPGLLGLGPALPAEPLRAPPLPSRSPQSWAARYLQTIVLPVLAPSDLPQAENGMLDPTLTAFRSQPRESAPPTHL